MASKFKLFMKAFLALPLSVSVVAFSPEKTLVRTELQNEKLTSSEIQALHYPVKTVKNLPEVGTYEENSQAYRYLERLKSSYNFGEYEYNQLGLIAEYIEDYPLSEERFNKILEGIDWLQVFYRENSPNEYLLGVYNPPSNTINIFVNEKDILVHEGLHQLTFYGQNIFSKGIGLYEFTTEIVAREYADQESGGYDDGVQIIEMLCEIIPPEVIVEYHMSQDINIISDYLSTLVGESSANEFIDTVDKLYLEQSLEYDLYDLAVAQIYEMHKTKYGLVEEADKDFVSYKFESMWRLTYDVDYIKKSENSFNDSYEHPIENSKQLVKN